MYFCIVCVTPLVKISSVLTRLACLNKVFTYLPTYLLRRLLFTVHISGVYRSGVRKRVFAIPEWMNIKRLGTRQDRYTAPFEDLNSALWLSDLQVCN